MMETRQALVFGGLSISFGGGDGEGAQGGCFLSAWSLQEGG